MLSVPCAREAGLADEAEHFAEEPGGAEDCGGEEGDAEAVEDGEQREGVQLGVQFGVGSEGNTGVAPDEEEEGQLEDDAEGLGVEVARDGAGGGGGCSAGRGGAGVLAAAVDGDDGGGECGG